MQTSGKYINRQNTTVLEWMALWPIYEVCEKDTGYDGRGGRCEPWWRQTVPMEQMRATIESISSAARAW